MKKLDKKRTRILSRFCALLSSLLMCMLLTVPAFASNNASTQKWYVADEADMTTESGKVGRYLKLTPYVGGEEYAATFRTYWASSQTLYYDSAWDIWVEPINYPQVWRSSLPLGGLSYVEFSKLSVQLLLVNGQSVTSSGPFVVCAFLPSEAFTVTTSSSYSSAYSITGTLQAVPYYYHYMDSSGVVTSAIASGSTVYVGSTSLIQLQSFDSFQFGLVSTYNVLTGTQSGYTGGFKLVNLESFWNASTDDLGFYILPSNVTTYSNVPKGTNGAIVASMVVSYWIDANKLPAGLQVGDEFPANDDAFDALRDDLLEQFPESEEHINNDKADWEDLRDAETIPEDAANSFFELLGGVFSIDMFGTIALMVCGFTALLILTRKAMN